MSRYRPGPGFWDTEIPTPLVAVICGASFFLGYRCKAYVNDRVEDWKRLKSKIAGSAKGFAIGVAMIPILAGVVFAVVRAKRLSA
eukprot:CAMPEP_0173391968 /NCGR_PEP_ID=MMETSP1356-20130122/18689_1 /TAXON_ID=77927 ORGANISM="Hemiselmis virescens, Strain PCC157" /NCGR_SAMPLE_ID=MMETSP1356 /ASSEMBLY_ACC=CAM_ASM_000847 /LENGTH=84 /DNA_ID=CAMNT_0014349675 /DNA_START=42 /DNA_END=296 /DNA_ORIENTATION=-